MCSPTLKSLWHQFDSLTLHNDVLSRKFLTSNNSIMQVIVPTALTHTITKQAHGHKHLGWLKAAAKLQQHYFWPSWKGDLKKSIRTCDLCHKRAVSTHKTQGYQTQAPQFTRQSVFHISAKDPSQELQQTLYNPSRFASKYSYSTGQMMSQNCLHKNKPLHPPKMNRPDLSYRDHNQLPGRGKAQVIHRCRLYQPKP